MKTQRFQKVMAGMAIATVALLASNALAQDATTPAPAAATVAAAPQLSAGASQVLQLAKAKVSDETIIAFIKNSNDSYSLSADQIIYLQQQGVSSTVLNLMLTQPKSSTATSPTATVASTATVAAPAAVSTATVAPTVVTYVPTTYYYSQPYYYPSYYGWGCAPAVSLSFGFGSHWGGGGWHGGGHGGHR